MVGETNRVHCYVKTSVMQTGPAPYSLDCESDCNLPPFLQIRFNGVSDIYSELKFEKQRTTHTKTHTNTHKGTHTQTTYTHIYIHTNNTNTHTYK